MDEPRKVAFCAPGLEILARFALIENGRDADEVTAEIRQTPYVGLGDVIVADLAAFELPPAAEFARVAPPTRPFLVDCLLGLRMSRPQPMIIITGC